MSRNARRIIFGPPSALIGMARMARRNRPMSVEKLSTTQVKSTGSHWLGQAVQLLAIVLIVFLAKGAIAEPFYGGVPSPIAEPVLALLDERLRNVVVTFRTRFGLRVGELA